MRPPRVVIVGAGFGGLACARELAQLLIHVPLDRAGENDRAGGELPVCDHGDCGHAHEHSDGHSHSHDGYVDVHADITVVDQRNFHTFLPLLYQVATAGLNSADIAYPVRAILRRSPGVAFRQGRVTSVDWARRVVCVEAPGLSDDEALDLELPFDHLVVAAGAQVNWFDVPGAAEHSFPLYTLTDSVTLRNHVLRCFEAASADVGADRAELLGVVVVGGGPTGVETAGALAELFQHVLRRDYPSLDMSRARVTLVEQSDTLLGAFESRSRRHAIETLRRRGVEVRLGASVQRVAADHVLLSDGSVLPTSTVVWAAGVRAAPLTRALEVATGPGGRIVVGDDLSIVGRDGGWAIGDVAHITSGAGALPQLAQVAIQGGVHVARSIAETVAGHPTQPFVYRNKGIMATIGRRAAVAEVPHLPALRGGTAWLAWLGLHLVTLLGMRNRASVLLNWAWNYLTWDRGPRLMFGPSDRRRGGSNVPLDLSERPDRTSGDS